MENIRDCLNKGTDEDVLLFIYGLALGNPGPRCTGAVGYIDGYKISPVLLERCVIPVGNNYTEELVDIQLRLEFLSELDGIQNRPIHILTDRQTVIKTTFGIPSTKHKIDIVFDIKNNLGWYHERNNKINVHWVPWHKGTEGNVLADKQEKEAAS